MVNFYDARTWLNLKKNENKEKVCKRLKKWTTKGTRKRFVKSQLKLVR